MNSRISFYFAATTLVLLLLGTREVRCQIVGAVYFLSNNINENHVIACGIARDGKLTSATSHKTRGKGGVGELSGIILQGLDPLGSQDAVIVKDNLLFAVNAGDNSISMFAISKKDPTCLIFKVKVNSGGEYPVAVAYAPTTKMLCVANGGKKNNIQCFHVPNSRNITIMPGAVKDLNLNVVTPPHLYGSVSDLLFSPDETKLFVAVKGVPPFDKIKGHFYTFDMTNGIGNPVKSQPKGIQAPFGFSIVPGTGVNGKGILIAYSDFGIAADKPGPEGKGSTGGFGLAQIDANGYEMNPNNSKFIIVPSQFAICWSVFSPRTKSLFLTDPIFNLVTEASVDPIAIEGKILKQHDVKGKPLDATVAGLKNEDIMYILASLKPSIQVIQIKGAGDVNIIQDFEIKDIKPPVTLGQNVVGIANYVIPS